MNGQAVGLPGLVARCVLRPCSHAVGVRGNKMCGYMWESDCYMAGRRSARPGSPVRFASIFARRKCVWEQNVWLNVEIGLLYGRP